MSKVSNVLEFALSEGIELNETQKTVLALREKGVQTFVLMNSYQLDLINAIWNEYTRKYTLTAKPRLDR